MLAIRFHNQGRVQQMKKKRFVPMLSALALLIAVTLVTAGCGQANRNTGNNANQNNNGNIADGLNIQPTGEAHPALKGRRWKAASSDSVQLFFAEKGNTVSMASFVSVYTVNGSTVSFDFSKSAKAWSAMTFDTYINGLIAMYNKEIAKIDDLSNKEQNEIKKKEYKKQIDMIKQGIEKLKNLPPEEKDKYTKGIEAFKKIAKAFEPYAKFDGTLNTDKTELTIEKFPVQKAGLTVEVKKVVFKKQ